VTGAILDSSVLVKLVLSEESSNEAKAYVTRILDGGGAITTTDSALPEAGNAIWKRAHLLHQLDAEGYHTAMGSLIKIVSRMEPVPTIDIAGDAADIALEEGVTFYDALYVAACSHTGSRLLTADKRQYDAAHGRVESTLIGRRAA
jgi:predicted nucleic acid-binding protein